MQMRGFLLGGLVGAAAALYVSRNRPELLAGMNWDKTMARAGKWLRNPKLARAAKGMLEDV